MKVYISADIEGVTNVTNWDETELYHDAHAAAKKQMTREVLAACRGALAAAHSPAWFSPLPSSSQEYRPGTFVCSTDASSYDV